MKILFCLLAIVVGAFGLLALLRATEAALSGGGVDGVQFVIGIIVIIIATLWVKLRERRSESDSVLIVQERCPVEVSVSRRRNHPMNDPSENRRQFTVGIFVFLFLVGALAASAQTAKSRPDLSGKWALKEVQPTVAALLLPSSVESFSINLTIEQSGEILKVTTVTKQRYRDRTPKEVELTSVKTYYLDGRGETNPYETRSGTREAESKTESRGDKIIITKFAIPPNPSKKREIFVIEEWFLKGDLLIVNTESRLIRPDVRQSGRRQVFVRI